MASSNVSKAYSTQPIRPDVQREIFFQKGSEFLSRWGVETQGITPIPTERRTDKRLYQLFFVWFSANFNILNFGTGSAGPAFFSLGFRASLATILLVDIMCVNLPHPGAVFGPKLGTRGMVQSRFSWGYYGSIIPSLLNVISMQGYLILNCIIGGQSLAAVSHHLNDTLGIVIVGASMFTTSAGVDDDMNSFETYSWIPKALGLLVILGVGGKHLNQSTSSFANAILSFGCFVASAVIGWCTLTPDYGVYHDAEALSLRIFTYTYLGLLTSNVPWHLTGAAFAAAAPGVPAWKENLEPGFNIGQLLAVILSPAGVFGKFLLVLLALSTSSACAPTMYTFGTSFMTIAPFLARLPQCVFAVLSTAILIPLAILGARHSPATFFNGHCQGVIGYWSTAFAAIVLSEHFFFRSNNFASYTVGDWDNPARLPFGIAAVLAFAGAFAVIVPSMSQTEYTGPIAKAGTGDIGVLTGFLTATLLYGVLRTLERRLFPKRSS
ncbi:cytosine-purine permease [Laccaria bicolor S238N-H82]|uniref:Cytosine-purine permease n=1 Tax=Laccaria bicolor (strain S238N-H82 / ATCC MYA-4686) TaxID=486041 RepID=B0CZA5_LACBS|nr:cytosine-purine permease [Laccaria bicolor S238N-H82]EDR12120.1 cytosine-purine permease [Laccaria bicolor S238N-H82]|eukprot:XP_001876384.1 cytosine-purine permease [Laccaria bicolor S238N-H82]